MIKIDNKTDIKSLEQAYEELSKSNAVDITISKGLSAVDFGLIPAIIQFFSTWFQKSAEGKIIFNLKDEKELPEFYDSDYLFPSLVYCWSREMVDVTGKDLKPFLKEQNLIKHDKMRKQKEGGGPKVMLSCFDHLSVKNGLLNAFYTDGIFISSELEFDFAIEKSIRQIVSLNRSLRTGNIAPVYDDIIAIIYELMKNTDDWGRTDENNKPLSPNTRGLFLKLHRRKREGFSSGFENFAGLKNYFSVENFEANAQDELYFMELSVYDTGIGFVKRNQPDEGVIAETAKQVEIIRNCLVKNNTTATGIAKTIKGQGLDRIMKILDNKGLFWLRTQNVSIFRNLRENRYKENMTSADIELFDWFTDSSSSFSSLAAAQGSVVTLVYPFSNISNA
ncbi:MAG: hypothetical protein JSR97_11645 [Verrucomicrobia bacterium]|nr:hypothetical protein [Verrucomicrobiota bacterium]